MLFSVCTCSITDDALLVEVDSPNSSISAKKKSRASSPISGIDATNSPSSINSLNSATTTKSPNSVGKANTAKSPDTPRKQALRGKIQNLRQKLYRLGRKLKSMETKDKEKISKKERKKREFKKLYTELSKHLTGMALEFVVTQIRVGKKSPKGIRWTTSEKAFALSILHSSPKTYRMLRKIITLPSITTLRRAMQNIKIFPGFNENILSALEEKVKSLPASAKLCVLLLDEMSLKESMNYNPEKDYIEGLEDFGSHGRTKYVANHATVFMARGITAHWKQAVGYCLSSGPIDSSMLKSLVLECVDKLSSAGFEVKVILGDQGSNNRKMFESLLGVTKSSPYFLHDNRKIFVMLDPPHLLKNTRNNLKKTGFMVDGQLVKWDYIERFYYTDCKNSVRMAPKLSQKHIDLPPFSPLRVKLATQVLSHSVAAGISTMVTLGALPKEAEHTALFVEKMDQIFNMFNSGSLTSNSKMRHAMTSTSGHTAFLQECLTWMKSVQSCTKRALPCLNGWEMAMQCLLLLWEVMVTIQMPCNFGITFVKSWLMLYFYLAQEATARMTLTTFSCH